MGSFEIRSVPRGVDPEMVASSCAVSGEYPTLILTSGKSRYVPPASILLRLRRRGAIAETTSCFQALRSYNTGNYKRLIIVDLQPNHLEKEFLRRICLQSDKTVVILERQT